MFLYWLTKFCFRLLAALLFRLKVEGRENLPSGGFILAANHASSLDPFLLIAAIPRYIRWLVVYEYYDQKFFQWFLRQMRFIRVKENLPKEAFRALKDGEIIGAFPEGRRTWTGKIGPGRRGVAALARRSGCPVVPIAIIGSYAALPRTRKLLRAHPITVRIGPPISFSTPTDQNQDLQSLDQTNTEHLMHTIAHLQKGVSPGPFLARPGAFLREGLVEGGAGDLHLGAGGLGSNFYAGYILYVVCFQCIAD